jgi:DNA helicase-2/ATP-dependent DNA helicase PcrA
MVNMQVDYSQKFDAEYKQLNEKQQEAVDTIYGPVLVVAGPGTGKTQILALRIANLLKSDAQISPQNILCLTYTEEGKKNMRDRLFKLIGAETAQYVSVHTYHSFCNEVIQQNLNLFEKDSLDAASELEKIQYIKAILFKLDRNNILYNAKNPNANANYLLRMFSKMKQENWSADFLQQKTLEHIHFLENDESSISSKGPTKGQIKKTVAKEIESYKKSSDAIRLFDDYKNLMIENHRYDFDDMINWVIEMFQQNPDVLASYYERYQYLLVDEFQDTNGAQMSIIDLLSSYDDAPNVFVVGDDDQSIFRFQGASVENMKDFQRKYLPNGLKEICLKINYRSPQGVLDHAKNLIEKAGERLVNSNPALDKNLVSFQTEQKQYDYTPQIVAFHNPRYEKVFLAKKIQELIAAGVPPKEIAVLYYDNKSCIEMGEYLNLLNIPYYTRKNYNLFDDVLAKQILNILKYIASERSNAYSGDSLLFEILHYQFFGIPGIEIAKAAILSNDKAMENRKIKYSFRRFLQENVGNAQAALFIENGKDALQYAVNSLEQLIMDSYNLSLVQLMDSVIEKCRIIPSVLKSKNKFEELETLTVFFDFIKEEAHRNPDLNVNALTDLLDIMNENGIELPRFKLYGNEDAVRLFTVHASKGREFDHVFVAGVVKNQWEGRKAPPNTIKIPDNVFESAISKKDNDELRRMMYVALTRAKKELYVSYFNIDLQEKEMEKSLFLYEIFGENFEPEKPMISKDMLFEFETLMPVINEKVRMDAIEKSFVEKQLQHFELNVTALNHYLSCPLHFYFNNIVRIPSGLHENMSFGSAVHKALEKLFSEMKANNFVFPAAEEFENYFVNYMRRNKEKFSPEGYQRKMAYGQELLNNLYNTNINNWHKVVNIEFSTKAIFNGIPIKGFIDKVEYYENEIALVDYKTGDYQSDYTKSKLKSQDEDKDDIGGDYWRQAMFYKILLDNDKNNKYNATTAKYEFLEPDKKTKQLPPPFIFHFPKEHIDQVKTQITETWQKIQNHDFYEGCGKEKCEWCNFAKEISR